MSDSIASNKRIIVADALRGFALMGLFIVHMVEYFELYWYKPEPGWVHNTVFFLFGGKAYAIFALLFGFSFYVIMRNYNERGVDFRWRFIWRLLILLAMGYIHSLLYAGDILQLLALGGLLLVLFYRLSNVSISFLAIFLLLQIPTFIYAGLYAVTAPESYAQPIFIAYGAENFEVFANGSFAELLAHNAWDGQKAKWAFFIETGRIWNVFGLMLVGFLFGRAKVFERVHEVKKLLVFIAAFLALYFFLGAVKSGVVSVFSAGMPQWFAGQAISYLVNLSLIGLGVALFLAVYQIGGMGLLFRGFAASGRLTLTLYIAQSILFVPLFYGFGMAWFNSIGQLNSLILGVVAWVAQWAFSLSYVQRFRYGPLEKLWRKATLVGLVNRSPSPT